MGGSVYSTIPIFRSNYLYLSINNRQLSMDTLIFPKANTLYRFNCRQILYFKADGNYVEVYLQDGSKYTMTIQLKECLEIIKSQVQDNSFVRLGKSHIVYLPSIRHIDLTEGKIKFEGSKVEALIGINRKALKEIKDYLENN